MAGNSREELARMVMDIADCGWHVGHDIADAIIRNPEVVLRAMGAPIYDNRLHSFRVESWEVQKRPDDFLAIDGLEA